MLVLSRKVNEKIVIDGGIVLTVVKIEGGQVRLGIEAPSDVKILREEIADKRVTISRPNPFSSGSEAPPQPPSGGLCPMTRIIGGFDR